jgi:phage/plasmid-like protein (TIGR03299 family)
MRERSREQLSCGVNFHQHLKGIIIMLTFPLPRPTPRSIPRLVADMLTTTRNGLPPTRQNPWERSGVTLMAEATTDPDIAIKKAGLDWTVERVDLRCADTLDPVPDFSVIRRSSDNGLLGVVGKDYEPFQNQQMFDVFKDLARINSHHLRQPFTIETAGSFHHGKVVWALAHLPDLGIRIGDDEAKTYLLISNGHTGNRTLIIAPTTVRVICKNSLRLAENQAFDRRKRVGLAGGFTLKHTPGIHSSVNDAKAAFAATLINHAVTKSAWQHLAAKKLTTKLEKDLMARIFGAPGPDETDRAKSLRKSREERIAAILASPTSQVRGTKDTLFSAMQAVVEYVDHDRTTRTGDGGDAEESRLFSANFGSGAELKERAWTAALEIAEF